MCVDLVLIIVFLILIGVIIGILKKKNYFWYDLYFNNV